MHYLQNTIQENLLNVGYLNLQKKKIQYHLLIDHIEHLINVKREVNKQVLIYKNNTYTDTNYVYIICISLTLMKIIYLNTNENI